MTAAQTPEGPKKFLKAMRILCGALMIGVVVFAAIVLGITATIPPVILESELPDKNIFLYIAAANAIICLVIAFTRYKKNMTALRQQQSNLDGKLAAYRTALILYMAVCEGAALFSVIVLFLTSQHIVLGITAIMLLAMFIKMPTKEKIIAELDLDWKEQQELE